jgi:hypothetical protein
MSTLLTNAVYLLATGSTFAEGYTRNAEWDREGGAVHADAGSREALGPCAADE